MKYSDGGKGSSRRNEDAEKIRNNWDLIFGRKPKAEDSLDKKKHQEDKKHENSN